jgi:hypothetical protein
MRKPTSLIGWMHLFCIENIRIRVLAIFMDIFINKIYVRDAKKDDWKNRI